MIRTIYVAIKYIYLTWTYSHFTHIFSISGIQMCAKREHITFLYLKFKGTNQSHCPFSNLPACFLINEGRQSNTIFCNFLRGILLSEKLSFDCRRG